MYLSACVSYAGDCVGPGHVIHNQARLGNHRLWRRFRQNENSRRHWHERPVQCWRCCYSSIMLSPSLFRFSFLTLINPPLPSLPLPTLHCVRRQRRMCWSDWFSVLTLLLGWTLQSRQNVWWQITLQTWQ